MLYYKVRYDNSLIDLNINSIWLFDEKVKGYKKVVGSWGLTKLYRNIFGGVKGPRGPKMENFKTHVQGWIFSILGVKSRSSYLAFCQFRSAFYHFWRPVQHFIIYQPIILGNFFKNKNSIRKC